jgi:hypothetical protein
LKLTTRDPLVVLVPLPSVTPVGAVNCVVARVVDAVGPAIADTYAPAGDEGGFAVTWT